MNWQECIVALFLLLCVLYMGRSVYRFYRKLQKNVNPCDTCVSDCEIKRLYEHRRKRCEAEKKKTKKSCCG